jgi:hypothetical protein
MPKWTPTTLKAHLVGELNVARNATGSSTRLADIVSEAYEDLWMEEEWRFRRRWGSFVTVAGTETAALTSVTDFDKLDSRFADDQDSYDDEHVIFTEEPEVFMHHQKAAATQTGYPDVALIEPTNDSGYTHLIRLAPIPNEVVTRNFPYLCTPPDLTVGGLPLWPYRFHSGWHKLAKAKALEAFRRNKAYETAMAIYDAWREKTVSKSNEFVRNSASAIEDGNNDIPALTSQGGADCVRLEPDG